MRNLPRIAAVGALASALILSGCASSDEGAATADSKGALAMSYAGMDIQIWVDTLKFMKPIVEDAGYELLSDDPQWDVQSQVSNWQGWIQRGDVKAIMGYPVQSDSLIPVTSEAASAGIPIIGYASTWEGVEHALLLDSFEDGRTLGQLAGEWVVETHGEGVVPVVVMADRSVDLPRMRAEGIEAGLAETAPNAKVIDLNATSRDEGYDAAQTQMVADPATRTWLAIGDDAALGAYRALVDSGVAVDDDDYLVTSLDATNESLDLIKIPGSIWRFGFILPAKVLAEANAQMLIAAAEGDLSDDVVLQSVTVDPSNADEFYVN